MINETKLASLLDLTVSLFMTLMVPSNPVTANLKSLNLMVLNRCYQIGWEVVTLGLSILLGRLLHAGEHAESNFMRGQPSQQPASVRSMDR